MTATLFKPGDAVRIKASEARMHARRPEKVMFPAKPERLGRVISALKGSEDMYIVRTEGQKVTDTPEWVKACDMTPV